MEFPHLESLQSEPKAAVEGLQGLEGCLEGLIQRW